MSNQNVLGLHAVLSHFRLLLLPDKVFFKLKRGLLKALLRKTVNEFRLQPAESNFILLTEYK